MPQLGSRVRERIATIDPSIVIGNHLITYEGQFAGGATHKVNTFGHPMYDFSRLEKSWDESHQREEIVMYYIKRKGRRRLYITEDTAIAYRAAKARLGQPVTDLYAKVGRSHKYVSGGPLTIIRTSRLDEFTVKARKTYINTDIKPWEAKYEGGFLPTGFSLYGPSAPDLYQGYTDSLSMNNVQALHDGLEALGTSAWNRARPKTSLADLPTFVGELRDLPGQLRTTAKGFHDLWSTIGGKKYPTLKNAPKELANHFLNHAFGWAPFVNDLKKFYDVQKYADYHINQMVRDNGQWIKRGRRVEESTEIKETHVHPGPYPQVYPFGMHEWLYKPRNGIYGQSIFSKEEYTRTWFVGSFRYYIPRPPDNQDTRNYNRVMDMMRLYGVNLSPSVIWNLTPWSWLGDWWGNVGDIIDNVTAQNNDNLTARYAYIMRHKITKYRNSSVIHMAGGDASASWTRNIESKVRIEAYPFGFGLTGGGIDSTYRAAILGALGLTRKLTPSGSPG